MIEPGRYGDVGSKVHPAGGHRLEADGAADGDDVDLVFVATGEVAAGGVFVGAVGDQLDVAVFHEDVGVAGVQADIAGEVVFAAERHPVAIGAGHARRAGFVGDRAFVIGDAAAQREVGRELIAGAEGDEEAVVPVLGGYVVGLGRVFEFDAQLVEAFPAGPGDLGHHFEAVGVGVIGAGRDGWWCGDFGAGAGVEEEASSVKGGGDAGVVIGEVGGAVGAMIDLRTKARPKRVLSLGVNRAPRL